MNEFPIRAEVVSKDTETPETTVRLADLELPAEAAHTGSILQSFTPAEIDELSRQLDNEDSGLGLFTVVEAAHDEAVAELLQQWQTGANNVLFVQKIIELVSA